MAQGRNRPHIRDKNFPGKSQAPRRGYSRGGLGGGLRSRHVQVAPAMLGPPLASECGHASTVSTGSPARSPPTRRGLAWFPCRHLPPPPRCEHTLRGNSLRPPGVRGPPQTPGSKPRVWRWPRSPGDVAASQAGLGAHRHVRGRRPWCHRPLALPVALLLGALR